MIGLVFTPPPPEEKETGLGDHARLWVVVLMLSAGFGYYVIPRIFPW